VPWGVQKLSSTRVQTWVRITWDGPVHLRLGMGRDFSLTFLMQLEPCVTVFFLLLLGDWDCCWSFLSLNFSTPNTEWWFCDFQCCHQWQPIYLDVKCEWDALLVVLGFHLSKRRCLNFSTKYGTGPTSSRCSFFLTAQSFFLLVHFRWWKPKPECLCNAG